MRRRALLTEHGDTGLVTSNHVRGETWTFLRHRPAVEQLAVGPFRARRPARSVPPSKSADRHRAHDDERQRRRQERSGDQEPLAHRQRRRSVAVRIVGL
jgi:hypothetical protein